LEGWRPFGAEKNIEDRISATLSTAAPLSLGDLDIKIEAKGSEDWRMLDNRVLGIDWERDRNVG
jgi:hypothetical protein